jgi:hypothetical protein
MGELREAARVQLPTIAGEFDARAFRCGSGYIYLALIKGDLGDGRSVLTRVAIPAPAGHWTAAR